MHHNIQIKRFISSAFSSVGGFFILSRLANNPFTLMYHRIISSSRDNNFFIQPGMYVTPHTFRSHIRFLKKNYHIISLNELVVRLINHQDIGRCCAITFDDGWADNYTQAFPLLVEYQVPATIFIATSFIGTDRLFWPEELTFYLNHIHSFSCLDNDPLFKRLIGRVKPHANNDAAFYDRAIMEFKTWTPQDRDELLSRFRKVSDAVVPQRQLMTWEEAKQMQDSGLVTFGAHTANHVILDQVSIQEAEKEIRESRRHIEKHLGVSPEFFAYPNGNFNSELKEVLQKCGFKGAVTTRKKRIEKGVDLFEIPRIGVHQDISSTIPMLQARVFLKCY